MIPNIKAAFRQKVMNAFVYRKKPEYCSSQNKHFCRYVSVVETQDRLKNVTTEFLCLEKHPEPVKLHRTAPAPCQP